MEMRLKNHGGTQAEHDFSIGGSLEFLSIGPGIDKCFVGRFNNQNDYALIFI